MALDRRGFVKFLVGGVVGTLATPIPWKLIDDSSIWTQNWSWIPRVPKGEITYAPVTSKLCPTSCGLRVAMVNGQPFRTEGDTKNPLSLGGISSLAVSEVQLHYSPARLKGPMRKEDNGYKAVSWDDGMKALADAIKGKKKVAVISGDDTGSINDVLSGFVAAAGSTDFYMMPNEAQVASRGWSEIMGGKGQVGYDLEKADFVLAISADLFETWGPSVRNAKAFNASHPIGDQPKATYVYAGPCEDSTATACDRFVGIKAGSETAFALGLAAALIRQGAKAGAGDFGDFASFVNANYDAKKVEALTGVPAQVLDGLAADLAKAKAPLVVVGTGEGSGAAPFVAGMSLNLLLDRVGKPGGVTVLPEAPAVVNGAMTRSQAYKKDLVQYLLGIESGKIPAPEVLLVYDANPVFALPQTEAVAKALQKIPFIVSFSPFMDETSAMAHLVLPAAMPLERADDVYTPYGLGSVFYTQNKPVMKPVRDCKPTGDVVLATAKAAGIDLGFAKFDDVLKAKAGKVGGLSAGSASGLSMGAKFLAGAATLQNPSKDLPLSLAPVSKLNVGTAQTGIPPHNVSAIRSTTLLDGLIFVHMNSATAQKAGVSEGNRVKVSGPQGEIKALVHISESVAADVVTAPLGFGHTAFDEYSKAKGDNVYKILTVATEPGTGMSVWTGSKVKVAKI